LFTLRSWILYPLLDWCQPPINKINEKHHLDPEQKSMDLVQFNNPNLSFSREVRENEILLDILIIGLAFLLVFKIIHVVHRAFRRFLLRRRPIQNNHGLPVVLRRPSFRP